MREYEIDGTQFSTVIELPSLLDAILEDAGLFDPEEFRVVTLDGLSEVLGGWSPRDRRRVLAGWEARELHPPVEELLNVTRAARLAD